MLISWHRLPVSLRQPKMIHLNLIIVGLTQESLGKTFSIASSKDPRSACFKQAYKQIIKGGGTQPARNKCVCVWEGEREKERKDVCVCVCVCVDFVPILSPHIFWLWWSREVVVIRFFILDFPFFLLKHFLSPQKSALSSSCVLFSVSLVSLTFVTTTTLNWKNFEIIWKCEQNKIFFQWFWVYLLNGNLLWN